MGDSRVTSDIVKRDGYSERVDNNFVMYPPERITEVIDLFSALLKDADNSGTLKIQRIQTDEEYTAVSKDARKYWAGLRREGANILGVARHLQDQLAQAENVIEHYHNEEQRLITDRAVETAKEWLDNGPDRTKEAAELAQDYLDKTDHE
jgi:hypothetical protein|tara:strand:- start:1515 stop:1964 length:450 start_codon:yes stop_codon:yes gene_type:complete